MDRNNLFQENSMKWDGSWGKVFYFCRHRRELSLNSIPVHKTEQPSKQPQNSIKNVLLLTLTRLPWVSALITLSQSQLKERKYFSAGEWRELSFISLFTKLEDRLMEKKLILDKIWRRINNNNTDEFCVETQLRQGNPVLVPLASRFLHRIRGQERQ